MMRKVLLTATVQSHIAQFHTPLIKLLKKNGYEVHIAAKDNLHEKDGLAISGVDKTYNLSFDRNPFKKSNIVAYNKLKEIIRKEEYEVIHCNTPVGGVITRLANQKFNFTKTIYTAHGFHFYEGASLKSWLLYYPIEKYLAKYTDAIITINKEDYKIANNKFNTKVCYTHGVGFNENRFYQYSDHQKKQLRTQFGYKDTDIIILCVGELNENKNQKTIIKAFKEVCNDNKNFKLIIAGEGPLRSELEQLTKTLNICDSIKFLGYKSDIQNVVNMCDISTSASFREGLPLNVIEAMACGKPVVASINRGHRELVSNDVDGFLVDPNNSRDFYNNFKKLENPVLRRKLGQQARSKAELFNTKNVTKELEGIYKDFMN